MGAWFAGLTRTVSSLPCWASTTWPLPDPSAATQWWTFLRYDLCDPHVIMWLPIKFHYTAFLQIFFFNCTRKYVVFANYQAIRKSFLFMHRPTFFFLNYLCQDPTSASPSLLKLTASPRPPGIEGTGGRPASLYRWQITQAQSETLRKEKASIKNSSLAHSSTLQTLAQPSLGTPVFLWNADYSNVIISHSQ